MTIRIYNTLSKKKEIFKPIKTGMVKMYVCGPTVYDSCHLGHARSVVVFDVITRYLKEQGYKITYVRNFTDVDDKIIKRANKTGITTHELTTRFIREFYEDMDLLYVKRADIEPKVTDHMDDIIKFIEKLVSKNIAYEIDGDVFFAIDKFEEYGKLSGRKLEDMQAGSRVVIDQRKKNPFDFALWKSSKPGEPFWDSPFGTGRPGWHIECSAMSCKYLGETFDIHGGGKDLIFPHHENEIAQSESLHAKPYANYWIHNGFVRINQEKMSKSLGNYLSIKELLKTWHPEVLRLFLLSNHYRSPIDFTDKNMCEAGIGLDKMYSLLERAQAIEIKSTGDSLKKDEYWNQFTDAMDDDFNTARGIGILFKAIREMNRLFDMGADSGSLEKLSKIQNGISDIKRIGQVLGILNESLSSYSAYKKSQGTEENSLDSKMIEQLIDERTAARQDKNWAKADQIRKKLEENNISLEDSSNGTMWKYTVKQSVN